MHDPTRRSPRGAARTLALSLIALLTLTAGGSAAQETAIPPISGPIDTAYIARGYDFADSLGGSVLAALTTSPMLLIPGADSDVIPLEVADRLRVLQPAEIVILGGEVAISARAEDALAVLQAEWRDPTAVRRIAGATRIETARLISEEIPSMVLRAARADHADDAAAADRADEADHALEADHAAQADDADAVGGLGPDDLATAGHTHDVQQAFSRQGEDPTDIPSGARRTKLSIDVTAPDPCGDGTTIHRYLAEGTHNFFGVSGDAGDLLAVATGVITDGEEVTFATFENPFPSSHLRAEHRGMQTFSDMVHTARVFELGPGDHTFRLRIHNGSVASIGTNFHTLIITHYGYTCGAAPTPLAPAPAVAPAAAPAAAHEGR